MTFYVKTDVGSDLTSHVLIKNNVRSNLTLLSFMPKNDVRLYLTSHSTPKNDVIQLKSTQFDTIQCNSMRFNGVVHLCGR